MDLFLGLAGIDWAILGAVAAVAGGGVGSSVGIAIAASVTGGVLGEDPDKFAGMLALCALPGTQGFYGFITGMLVMVFFGLMGGGGGDLAGATGFHAFLACLPVMFNCAISGIYQGKASLGASGHGGPARRHRTRDHLLGLGRDVRRPLADHHHPAAAIDQPGRGLDRAPWV